MRRTTTIIAGACTALLALSACGDSGSENEVVFATVGGVVSEALDDSAYAQLADKGIEVLEETPNDRAKLLAMTESGNPIWDVYYSAPYDTLNLCDEAFEKIDYDRIETTGMDLDLSNDCGISFIRSSFVLAYNADTYGDNPPTGWEDFYDPDFPGQRGIMNYPKDMGLETALLGDGLEPDDLYPIDYDRAFATLDKIRDDISFFETGAQQQDALASGSVDMMLAWPTRAHGAKQAGANIEVAWNQPIDYGDALGIVKGAANEDAAYELLNAIISPETQTAIAATIPMTPVNEDATLPDDPEILEFVNSEDKSKGTTIVRDDEWWQTNREDATEKWTNWVNQ